ncbi:DUF86 domain-containing protein [Candidatus Pacearchaeota archaeon]|nr:DUF86 domain-containing protein [Candidatus Pacearchaeota archaeon]
MKRDYKLFIDDIRKSINQIEYYMKNISEKQLKNDLKIQDAIIRRLEIIGEATKNIPRALKEKNRQVPWFDMSQFRDFITHSYFELSIMTLWKTIKIKLPLIKKAMSKIALI